MKEELIRRLEDAPIIAAVRDRLFDKALASPVEVIFLLGGDIATIADRIKAAKTAGKYIFIHIDLCDGIGKDRSGVRFLASCGADGIISTKSSNAAAIHRIFTIFPSPLQQNTDIRVHNSTYSLHFLPCAPP